MQNNTQIFNRPITTSNNNLDNIRGAYRTAGLDAPTAALEIRNRINEAPSPARVAEALAREALTTTDPEKFYQDALEQIREAHAADTLKQAFSRGLSGAITANIPRYQEQAAEDLASAFNKTVKALTTAAKKLPAHAPLDMAANVDNDTGSEYKTAREALRVLGNYAAIYHQPTPNGEPPQLLTLLPILDLPTAVTEQTQGTKQYQPIVINEAQLEGTRAIRRLGTDAKNSLDEAIIKAARGDYEGVSLSLATPQQHRERRSNARNAYQRQEVRKGNGVTVL